MKKQTKCHVHQAKIQISLGISPIWSETSLSAWRKPGSLATHWVHSEDSDQTGRMLRLIRVFAVGTCHFVGFVMRRLRWQIPLKAIFFLNLKGASFHTPTCNHCPDINEIPFTWSWNHHLSQLNHMNTKVAFNQKKQLTAWLSTKSN